MVVVLLTPVISAQITVRLRPIAVLATFGRWARVSGVSKGTHPHPTLGEGMMEAAMNGLGHAIHILNRGN